MFQSTNQIIIIFRKKNILGIYPIFKHTLISFWGRKPEFPMSEIRHAIYPANVCLPSFIVKSTPHKKIVGWNSTILNPFMFSDYKTNCEKIWFDKRSSLKHARPSTTLVSQKCPGPLIHFILTEKRAPWHRLVNHKLAIKGSRKIWNSSANPQSAGNNRDLSPANIDECICLGVCHKHARKLWKKTSSKFDLAPCLDGGHKPRKDVVTRWCPPSYSCKLVGL